MSPKWTTQSEAELSKVQRELPCASCDGTTRHVVLASVRRESYYAEEHESYLDEYQILKCGGCETVTFRHFDEWDPGGHPEEVQCKEKLYPPRLKGRKPLKDKWHLPDTVEKIYDEVHESICGGRTLLAGIGIRALVEAVCAEKGATGNNLEKKIDKLVDIGILK